MPNPFFHFKQFTVYQNRCAMKVTTDACLFGAWVVHKLKSINLIDGVALDIGTGTGLLSLMLAQETNLQIDALEINNDACLQANENIKSTIWTDRIKVYNQSLQTFITSQKYQVIFSNPPFYEDDLKSPVSARNSAMHDDTLKIDEIFSFAQQHLLETGHLFLLIPHKRLNELVNRCGQYGLYFIDVFHVKQTEKHDYFRSLLHFSKQHSEEINYEEMSMKMESGSYSNTFINYLNLFYLNL